VSDETKDNPGQDSLTGEPRAVRSYVPPRVEKLGNLRDLAGKTGSADDGNPIHPFAKK